MHRSVVVQWSRLGDLLQTRPLLEHIAQCHPGGEILLCADRRYAEIVARFSQAVTFCPVELERLSAQARHEQSHGALLREIARIVDDGMDGAVDEVYVLSRAFSAVVMARLLRPAVVHGHDMVDMQLVIPDPLRWFEQKMLTEGGAPIELADIWRTLDGRDCEPYYPAPLQSLPNARGDDAGVRHIGLICDAGDEHRTFPRSWMIRLIQALANSPQPAQVTLFGAKAEDESLSSEQAVTDLRGRTTLAQLCDMLAAQDVVIGADTGGLHLAAALDVPVIGLYFGGASCLNTGPYAPRSIVIQNPCWDDETILRIAARAQSKDEASEDEWLRPSLDEHGLLYSSSSWSSETRDRIAGSRHEFFDLFYGRRASKCLVTEMPG
jgi:ADP-heptose:LPS heptosyltransferase